MSFAEGLCSQSPADPPTPRLLGPTDLRCLVLLVFVAGIVFVSIPASASASAVSSSPAQSQDEGDIPADAGRIVGSPDAGPDPQQSGDRGGWAQFVTLGAVICGIGVVTWRIVHGLRQTPKPAPDS